jgi:hypothetical protein
MLEVEVQFNPLYQGVPLFGDVDRLLRGQGFSLWRLKNLSHYGLSEYTLTLTTEEEINYDYFTKRFRGRNGQLFWGDAFYVRDEIVYNDSRAWEVALKDACMAGILGFEDLLISSLGNSLVNCPTPFKEEIKNSFTREDGILEEMESDQILSTNQPSHFGLGLEDENADLLRMKSQLEATQAERDQALQQLNTFFQSRAYKWVSYLQSIRSFFRNPGKKQMKH